MGEPSLFDGGEGRTPQERHDPSGSEGIATLPTVSIWPNARRPAARSSSSPSRSRVTETRLHIDVPTEAEPILSDLLSLLPGASSESGIVRDM